MSHRYLFAVMLEGPAEYELHAIRQKHAIPSWRTKIGLHVTLLRPFWAEFSIAELARRAHMVTREHGPFTLELDGLGRFHNPEGSVLYVRVVNNAVISGLHQDLKQNLEYITGPADTHFTPHVSLSCLATPAQVDTYLRRLAGETIAWEMPCNHFALLRMDTEWRVVHKFNLW